MSKKELKQYIEKCIDDLAIKHEIEFGRIVVEIVDSKVVSCEVTTKFKREDKKIHRHVKKLEEKMGYKY